MENIDASRSSRSAHTENVTVTNIDQNTIEEIFTRVSEKNYTDINIYGEKFKFWINPTNYMRGRGRSSKFKAGLWKHTLQKPEESLSCAATAIVFTLGKMGYYGEAFRKNLGQPREKGSWIEYSKEVMDLCNWDDEVSVTELPEFVKFFPDHRLVLVNHTVQGSSSRDWRGCDYIEDEEKNIIYLYLDQISMHYSAIMNINTFIQGIKGRAYGWCSKCSSFHRNGNCKCGTEIKRNFKQITCKTCGTGYSLALNKHVCWETQCKYCAMKFKTTDNSFSSHRCPIFMGNSKPFAYFVGEEPDEEVEIERKEQEYNLWAYDIESALEVTDIEIPNYETVNGVFPEPEFVLGMLERQHKVTMVKQCNQVPNLIVWKNVFTGALFKSNNLDDFIKAMLETENGGYNIAIAHNAKGYDSRLIFEAMVRYEKSLNLEPLMRGTKFMRLKAGNAIFMDSLLHLPGSLSSLSEDFFPGEQGKGEFPHFFNTAENKGYIGPLPGDEFFDLKFTIKDEKSKKRHEDYRREWNGRTDWNADEKLVEYCIRDVEILAKIIKVHHEKTIEAVRGCDPRLAISPWQCTTSAGYAHKLFLLQESLKLDKDETDDKVIEEVTQSSWAALEPNEHYFAHLSLRGGRTEVRKFYCKPGQNEKIKSIDVHSMYPSIQIGKTITVNNNTIPLMFPVGTPVIEVHDRDYYPCNLHYTNPDKVCNCYYESKVQYKGLKIEVIEINPSIININSYIQEFTGFIMVDCIPPRNMYHPLLPVYDDETKKCVFSCEPIYCKVYTHVQLQVAISIGYVVTKIYRADRYKMAESKWKDLLGTLYTAKLYSSSDGKKTLGTETIEEAQYRRSKYLYENFGIIVDNSKFKKQPAMKLCAKIQINSAWGKHVESVDHTVSKIINMDHDLEEEEFFVNVDKGLYDVKDIQAVVSQTFFKFVEKRFDKRVDTIRPNLHKQYSPCAIFVPMYGQLMTWNILNQVGQRAIMCDTDSVKYISNGVDLDMEVGDCLGQWEDEGDLEEFVSIGLKSYGLRYVGGKESMKLKGCSLKLAHKDLINFDKMKDLVFEKISNVTIPQLSFDYEMNKGISTRQFLKKIQFDTTILKGDYDSETYTLFPFGFNKNL